MANLTRYDFVDNTPCGAGECDIEVSPDGEYVKFEDIKEFLSSASTDTGSPKLPEWNAVEKECGPYRTNGDRWHAGYAEGIKRCFRVIVRQLRS